MDTRFHDMQALSILSQINASKEKCKLACSAYSGAASTVPLRNKDTNIMSSETKVLRCQMQLSKIMS